MSKIRRARQQAARSKRAPALLRLESLEDRIVPAIDTLTSATVLDLSIAPSATTAMVRVVDHLEDANAVDMYRINVAVGDVVALDVNAAAAGLSGLDSQLRVFDALGNELFRNDNFDGSDSKLTFQAAATTYFIGVSGAHNRDYLATTATPLPASLLAGHTAGYFELLVTRQQGLPAAADLVGAHFNVVADQITTGATQIDVEYRVENRGAAPSGGFRIDFYLSTDNRITAGDTFLGFVTGVENLTEQRTFNLPTTAGAGTRYVGMIISPAANGESNTANNSNSTRGNDWDSVTVLTQVAPGTELRPDEITSPVSIASGATHTYNLVVSGAGAGLFELEVTGNANAKLTLVGNGIFVEATGRIAQHVPNNLGYQLLVSSPTGGAYQVSTRFSFTTSPNTNDVIGVGTRGQVGGDFNGDGLADLVLARTTGPTAGSLLFYAGVGDGVFSSSFAETVTPFANFSMQTADFDNDGKLDLLIVEDFNVRVYRNAGNGNFVAGPVFNLSFVTIAAAGDFDNDGNLDLAIGEISDEFNGPGKLLVYRGDGSGGFTQIDFDPDPLVIKPFIGIASDAFTDRLLVGDFNEDGFLDLVAGSIFAGGPVLLGDGTGSFTETGTNPFTGSSVVADLDGDGHLDLFAAPPIRALGGQPLKGVIEIARGNGSGGFDSSLRIDTIDGPRNIAVGDLNGDGKLDLLLNGPYTVSVLLNQSTPGQLRFGSERRFDLENNPSIDLVTSSLGDFNRDGRLDVAVATENAQSLTTLLGVGDGALQTGGRARVGNNPNSMVAGDFNNDGRLDIAVISAARQDLSVLLSQGDGTFAPEVIYKVNGASDQVVLGDFNKDGRLDLAVYLDTGIPVAGSDESAVGLTHIQLLLGLGDGIFQLSTRIDVAANNFQGPVQLIAGDFTGDGQTDLMLSAYGIEDPTGFSPQAYPFREILLAQDDLTFVRTVVVRDGFANATGDLNNDGKTDLVLTLFNAANEPVGSAVRLGLGNAAAAFVQTQILGTPLQNQAAPPINQPFTGSVKLGYFNHPTPFSTAPDTTLDVGILDRALFQGTLHEYLGRGDGTFATFPFSIGNVDDFIYGDFNADGYDDLVLVDNNEMQVLRNVPGGSFVPTFNFLFDTVRALATGDFDGDGNVDIAISGDEDVRVLLGRGNGEFDDASLKTSRAPSDTPLVADLNGDGANDVVVLSQKGQVLYRQGRPGEPGSYEAPVVVNPALAARDVALVRDPFTGQVRLVTVDGGSNQLSIYTLAGNQFNRSAGPTTIQVAPSRVVSADLNNDLRGDLVVINPATQIVETFLADGSGNFVSAGTKDTGYGPAEVSLADLNADNFIDLVVANELSGDVSVYLGSVTGAFGAEQRFRSGSTPYGHYSKPSSLLEAFTRQQTNGLVIGNFDGTGTLDIVSVNAGSNSFSFLKGLGNGQYADPRTFLTDSRPSAIVQGDFNRDGFLDVALLNNDAATVTIYFNDGAGNFFLDSFVVNAGNAPNGLSSFDVNGDGALDLLVGNEFGDVLIILGNGDGTFRPFVRVNQGVPFVTTDTNGDGVADVVLANQSVDQVLSQIRNAGTTTFSLGSFSQTSAQGVQAPGFLTLADVNNDNREDLLVANSGSNNVLVYLGTGPGQFSSTSMSFFAGTNPVSLAVLDLDNDGRRDVAVANQGSNDVTILKGSGSGATWTLTPGPRLAVGAGPNHIEAGQFDNDGVLDLMVTNAQQAEMWVLSGTGGGFFNDVTPAVLAMPGPINQTVLNNGLGFVLLNTGSIFTFNPFDFSLGTSNVYNSPTGIQTNSFTFRPGTTDIFTGRGDGSIAVLTASNGQYADSLVFNDARLTNPSALQVVGDDIYVTNQGNSMPVVIGFENIFGSGAIGGIGDDLGGSVTNLDSIDAARLSVIATTLASSSSTDDDDDDETDDDEAGDAFVGNNVGLIGSVNLLAFLFAQQSGVEEETAADAEGEAEIETPEWVEFVVGLHEALERFRADLRANNPELPELVDDSLAQLSLWMADSARGLDGWLTALAPPQREFETALLASRHAAEAPPDGLTGGAETAMTDAPTVAATPAALGWWGPLQIDWWSALTAATITSCAWLGWRRRRRSPREEAAALRP